MNKREVEIGGVYVAKVSGCLVRVRIDRESPYGGWDATNLETRRTIRIRSAARLRGEARPARPAAGAASENEAFCHPVPGGDHQ